MRLYDLKQPMGIQLEKSREKDSESKRGKLESNGDGFGFLEFSSYGNQNNVGSEDQTRVKALCSLLVLSSKNIVFVKK